MAKLDIAETRAPQDGRLSASVAGRVVDFRISTLPTTHGERLTLRHPSDHTKYRTLPQSAISRFEPLQVEVLRDGKLVYALPTIEQIRQRRVADVEALDPGIRRLVNPHIYHVSLSQQLWDLKQALIEAAMRQNV